MANTSASGKPLIPPANYRLFATHQKPNQKA